MGSLWSWNSQRSALTPLLLLLIPSVSWPDCYHPQGVPQSASLWRLVWPAMCRNAQRLALLTPTLRQPHPYQATPNNHAQTLLDHPCFRVRKNLETDRPNWKLTQMDFGHDNIRRLVSPPPPRVACPAQAQGHPFAILHCKGHSLPRGRQLSYSPY